MKSGKPVSAWHLIRMRPEFGRMLLANFISGAGDWFNTVAVLSLVLALTGSALAVGLNLAVRTLPQLLLGPLAGVVADRCSRRAVLVVTDVVSIGFALLLMLATSPHRLWLVYVATVLLVVASTFRSPAANAVVPSLVGSDELPVANGLRSSVSGSVMVVGAVLGGIASARAGVRLALALNAMSFAVSALLILSVHISAISVPARRGLASFREVVPILHGAPIVRVILVLSVLWPIGGGCVNVLASVYPVEVFHAGNAGVGLMYGAIGIGLLSGGLLARRVSGQLRVALVVACLMEGTCHLAVSRAPSIGVAAVCLMLATTAAGIGNACSATLLMRAIPSQALGRLFALIGMVSSATFAISLFGSGLLLAIMSPRTLGALAGLLIICTSAVGAIAFARGDKSVGNLPNSIGETPAS